MEFIKYDELLAFLTEVVEYYEKKAPTVSEYCDSLYVRISEGDNVQLREVRFLERLKECGQWMQPNCAANQVYHLMHGLGMKTVGHAGF